MKFGMNLLLWTDDSTQEEFLPLYARLKEMGFDGVELPIFDPQPERYRSLAARLDDLGLQRTATTIRTAEDNPISPDPAIRSAAVDQMKRTMDCCGAAGVTTLGGPFYAAIGEFSGEPPRADEWKWGVETLRTVAEDAERRGITLVLEFLNRFEIYLLNCSDDTARFARDVGTSNIGIHYDTFHAHIEEKDVARAIRENAHAIRHVHVSENDRSTPGQGQVEWRKTFSALKSIGYDEWLVIEAFGSALPSIAAATKIWRRMFHDEEGLAREGLGFMRSEWTKA